MSVFLSIDHASHRLLKVDSDPSGVHVSLVAPDGDTRSPYHRAVARHLRIVVDGRTWTLDTLTESVVVASTATGVVVSLADVPIAAVGATGAVSSTPLTPFEVRFLADNGVVHGRARSASVASLRTDLHTHFAGCVAGRDLLAVGLAVGAAYPPSLLAEAGIHAEGSERVRLDTLGEAVLARLAASFSVPIDRRVPFVDMERIYRLRAPITKHPDAFAPLCRRIGDDYAAMGATYVELSLANVVEARCLETIHRELPAIEEATGVTMRFLAAISRHDDLEWDLDLIRRFAAIARSRYFAGVDFMGHETNSTRAFARQLSEIAAWAHTDRPGFVVRVHAGENPAFPENVRVAAECVAGKNVSLRVGHGLYGVDERAMGLLRAAGAVVELNLSSNLALNNIQSAACLPARRYVDAGIPVVLGTDGYGIYQTTLALEAQAAVSSGLDPTHLARAAEDESRYVAARREAESRATVAPAQFVVPAEAPGLHYTPDVPRRKERERERRRLALEERLGELDVQLLSPGEVDDQVAGKLMISIAGAWREAWETVSDAWRATIRRELDALFATLKPAETVIVTGGTRFGVENEAQALARARGLPVLAALVGETMPESLAADLTHAWVVAPNLHAKAAGLYDLVRRTNGIALFVGGGGIVADEIQTASNLRLRYLVMDGPEGASTRHAARHPSRAFRTGAEVALRLTHRRWPTPRDPYWHTGPNPSVDVALFRVSPSTGAREVLLVRRDETAASEAGKWALPGAFQRTDAPRGVAWAPGREAVAATCARVLLGETGIDAAPWLARFATIGEYEGEGRDPRDTPEAWSRSIAVAATMPVDAARAAIAGGHDASDARWFALDAVPASLAFDHQRILADAVAHEALHGELIFATEAREQYVELFRSGLEDGVGTVIEVE